MVMARSNIVQENRVRRIAKRRGFTLKLSRRRDRQAVDYGKYWLTDARSDACVVGGANGVELDDVEAWLNSYERR
jgi:hypothetical protein